MILLATVVAMEEEMHQRAGEQQQRQRLVRCNRWPVTSR